MKIGIAGPVALKDIGHLLAEGSIKETYDAGGSMLLVSLTEALIQEGYTVSIFTSESSLEPNVRSRLLLSGRNLRVFAAPRRRRALRFDRGSLGRMTDFFALERQCLREMIQYERPEIVHAHWTYEFSLAALASGIPTLVTCHDSPWTVLRHQFDSYRLGRFLMALPVLRNMKHATAVSPYLAHALGPWTRVPIEVVPNPLAATVLSRGLPRLQRAYTSSGPKIGMLLSGWNSLKNPKPAMKAMANIRATFPDATMHLFGHGYGKGEEAEKWAATQGGTEAFVFRGYAPHSTAIQEISAMDIVVHPSLEESFGMSVAEAMGLGLPVIAGRYSGGVPWVVGAEDCLVDVTKPADIAHAVISLLSVDGKYQNCSLKNFERARSLFSPQSVATAYLSEYEKVLIARSRTR